MPVNTVRSAADNKAGWPPDEDPDIARALVTAWAEAYQDLGSDARTMPEGIFVRASDAGACARALGYRILRRGGGTDPERDAERYKESDPNTIADLYRFNIGTLVHDELAKHLEAAFGEGAKAEVKHVRVDEPALSMHVDAVITMPDGEVIAVEIKTINGFGFKNTIGAAKKDVPATGPRWNAVVQGALAGVEFNADRLVVLVFALELVGKSVAARYGVDELGTLVAQFSLTREEYTPIAEAEHKRMSAVLKIVQEDGALPPRSIPDRELPHGNRITNPKDGSWVQEVNGQVVNLGNTWHCDYCRDRGNCLRDGAT